VTLQRADGESAKSSDHVVCYCGGATQVTTDLADRVILMRGADEIERPLEDTSAARRLRGVLVRFA